MAPPRTEEVREKLEEACHRYRREAAPPGKKKKESDRRSVHRPSWLDRVTPGDDSRRSEERRWHQMTCQVRLLIADGWDQLKGLP